MRSKAVNPLVADEKQRCPSTVRRPRDGAVASCQFQVVSRIRTGYPFSVHRSPTRARPVASAKMQVASPKVKKKSNPVIPTKLLVGILMLLLHCPNQKRRTDTRSGTNNFSSANGESLNGEPASLALSYHQPAIPNPGSSKAQILNRSASVTKWVRSDQITVICLLFFFGFCLLVRKRQHHFPGCSSGHHFLAPASLTSWRSQPCISFRSFEPPTTIFHKPRS